MVKVTIGNGNDVQANVFYNIMVTIDLSVAAIYYIDAKESGTVYSNVGKQN